MVHAAASPTDATVPDAAVPGMAAGRRVAMKKHEAAGNDFLVHVDPGATWVPSPAFVVSVCDRRRGIGADGLVLVRPAVDDADLEMVLYNADGTRAEMSGNGIRCLVQAAVLTGLAKPGMVRVKTDAGLRVVEYEGTDGMGSASVEMGSVDLGEELESPIPGSRARRAGVGNPHVVVVVDDAGDGDGAGRDGAGRDGAGCGGAGCDGPAGSAQADLSAIDLTRLARQMTALVGEPVNVEVVQRAGEDVLALRVFERGVGETAACGTGSCAAAAVAHGFGLVGEVVAVQNPGGTLSVRLGAGPGTPVVLRGPVRHVADVVLAASALDAGHLV